MTRVLNADDAAVRNASVAATALIRDAIIEGRLEPGKRLKEDELARAVTVACDGCCEPSDAMIYPTIRELTQGGYITCRPELQGARRRNVCELTDRGRAAYR